MNRSPTKETTHNQLGTMKTKVLTLGLLSGIIGCLIVLGGMAQIATSNRTDFDKHSQGAAAITWGFLITAASAVPLKASELIEE